MHIMDVTVILAFTIYVLLDFFVIPKSYVSAEDSVEEAVQNTEQGSYTLTDTSYTDENISIQITTYRINDTDVYVADVQLSSISYLKTAFAQNTYGRNITASTSETADTVNAILAVNGDYYGARNTGYVVRNGTVYRTSSSGREDLVIHADGSFSFIDEDDTDSTELDSDDILQVFSFGPALIKDGEITVDENTEVDQAMTSNPRTAICEIEPLHYLLVVADGRTSASEGLSLYEMAEFLQSLGVTNAYNLDGGGSSTMVFNGTVVNNPTTNGTRISERKVSDIVYVGY